MKRTLAALLLLLTSCGGTGTGNPSERAANTTVGEASASAFASQVVMGRLCAKLLACFANLKEATCINGIEAEKVIDTELGLPSGTYTNYQAVIDAESAGVIVGNVTARTNCAADIDALSCSSVGVAGAYNSSSRRPFQHVDAMIPTGASSCPAIF